jgi:hypothetical protein
MPGRHTDSQNLAESEFVYGYFSNSINDIRQAAAPD